MITREQADFINDNAYVPEHSVELITAVSGGEPFLINGYFCCRASERLILVGYPLDGPFQLKRFEREATEIIDLLRPEQVGLIAQEIPESFETKCVSTDKDSYYILELPVGIPKGTIRRLVRNASKMLRFECSRELDNSHHQLAKEFIQRVNPPIHISTLLLRMWNYVSCSEDARVLNAWNMDGSLAAFFVVDFAPKNFSTFIIGCHSKNNYFPGASDMLMHELIRISIEAGKSYIHLGVGVNSGIRIFKQKWGGKATLSYQSCEFVVSNPSMWGVFKNGLIKQFR